jgi:hypothetical protein
MRTSTRGAAFATKMARSGVWGAREIFTVRIVGGKDMEMGRIKSKDIGLFSS